ncbi:hypothetical protein [Sandarakinorhabdus sp.]|uniref:hypothetical protein n=1 Tax=Sandarakinorhabdus sp. TaxID=1916663 RepID=UPI00286D9F1B|nr:hypothetical protein [Sandarakinorhabdus sp.]
MKFLNDESIFISLALLALAMLSTMREPGLFSSFLVLISIIILVFMLLRMNLSRLDN